MKPLTDIFTNSRWVIQMSRTQLMLVTSTGGTFISATLYVPCLRLSDDDWPRPHHRRRGPLMSHILYTNSMSHLNVTNPLSKNSTLNHKWTSLSLRNEFSPLSFSTTLCVRCQQIWCTTSAAPSEVRSFDSNSLHELYAVEIPRNSLTRKRVVILNLGRTIEGKVL